MDSWSPWLNAVLFLIAATAIWWAGTRLERYADAISIVYMGGMVVLYFIQ